MSLIRSSRGTAVGVTEWKEAGRKGGREGGREGLAKLFHLCDIGRFACPDGFYAHSAHLSFRQHTDSTLNMRRHLREGRKEGGRGGGGRNEWDRELEYVTAGRYTSRAPLPPSLIPSLPPLPPSYLPGVDESIIQAIPLVRFIQTRALDPL